MALGEERLRRLEIDLRTLTTKIIRLEKDSHPPQEYICCRKCGCEIAKTTKIEEENKDGEVRENE